MIETTLERIEEIEYYKYPYIGIFENGCIVLFIREKTGVCLNNYNGKKTKGEYSTYWLEDTATPYPHKVILQNK